MSDLAPGAREFHRLLAKARRDRFCEFTIVDSSAVQTEETTKAGHVQASKRCKGGRMPLFRLLIALTSMGALSSTVNAGSVTGRIEFIQAGLGYTPQNAYALVKVNGAPDNQPGCATDARFALNPATEAGKAFLALLMSAKAAGNTVTLVGTGACDVMGGEFESISYLQVLD